MPQNQRDGLIPDRLLHSVIRRFQVATEKKMKKKATNQMQLELMFPFQSE